MLFERKLNSNITKNLFKGKILLIYGARQVGKTTLVKNILKENSKKKSLYLNADDFDVKNSFENAQNFDQLKSIIGNVELLIIDEAQRIKDIGLRLKMIHDNSKQLQIIVTGSSSFELAQSIHEPLTGRSLSYILYPLSLEEISENQLELKRNAHKLLQYGSYPGIINESNKDKQELLKEVTEQYLFKDVLEFSGIKKSEYLIKLLKLLAYQIGQTVSYHEIATSIGLDQTTVAKYIDLLEKSFVLFKLGSYSNNLRNEIKKNQKIYFYDLGIRNALINDFNEIELRPDLGHLWENLLVIERLKHNSYRGEKPSYYFWKNYDQQEVDLIEDWGRAKSLQCYEFKYKAKKSAKFPASFIENYPESSRLFIDQNNVFELFDY
ncbi:MAG: ATP-binding protein [Candidatus Caenarcaniphilales bacterium]|jgi:hypothetical protein|nr:ATP-binding protein [Candidatus Caenarcaniphilales bacterium]